MQVSTLSQNKSDVKAHSHYIYLKNKVNPIYLNKPAQCTPELTKQLVKY